MSLVNARVITADGIATSIRFDSKVLALDTKPKRGDAIIDLDGAFVLPGLINAHDHLELNHYGLLRPREQYANASEWIDDLRPALQDDPEIRRNSSHPLAARLFIGALKNLLAGVTTVAHHNPRYREIGSSFPVRVVDRYGWAHSFALENGLVGAGGERGGNVRDRCFATPPHMPFMVHLGEGTDAAAASELSRLDALGCLRPNTVIVHGVALSVDDWKLIAERGASLVWCPASNLFLFGRTPPVRALLDSSPGARNHIALGSDSRVTGARDLLDEMRVAARAARLTACELVRMVTTAPAAMLRLAHAGRIAVGAPADLLVIPVSAGDSAPALLATTRRDVLLVTIDGDPRLGATTLQPIFRARRTAARRVLIDGVERLASITLARGIARSPIAEPGVQCLP